MIGLIATLAPTIGPTVGGYMTDALSWHWLFFINIVPGLIVAAATWLLVDFDKPDLSLLENFDWWGLLSMAGFLGALEYVLEEGPRHDWFDDTAITVVRWSSALSAIVFFARVLTARAPIVDLKAFVNRNFAVGSLFSFVLGIGLYGLTYIYPVYLAQIRGYDALMIGDTMFVSGAAMFLSAPLAGQLSQRFDPRFMLMGGFVLFAIGTWQMTYRHPGLGFLADFLAAGFPRARADVLHRAGDQHRARHLVARAREERLRPVQPDAQSRRRHRARRDQYRAERPHGPASHPPARRGELGARAGDRDARASHRAFSRLRRASDGAQADDGHGAPAGGGDELCRRVPDADGAVPGAGRARRHHEAAGARRSRPTRIDAPGGAAIAAYCPQARPAFALLPQAAS